MDKKIIFNKQLIDYSLIRSNIEKYIKISVYRNGKIVVTAPKKMSLKTIENNVGKKMEWVCEKIRLYKKLRSNGLSGRYYLDFKEDTMNIITRKLNYYNKVYNFKFCEVIVKNLKNKWSFCSEDNKLVFDCRVALLPKKLVNYIVVHELCHLVEFNHSENFWNLVKKTIPDYESVNKLIANY